MFLTMFGEKLNGTDPEDVIKNAFACFDEDNKGIRSQLILKKYKWLYQSQAPARIQYFYHTKQLC